MRYEDIDEVKMKQEDYVRVSNFFRSFSWGEKLVIKGNKLLTDIVYVAFLSLVLFMNSEKDQRLLRVILVCGISFILVSVFRKVCNSDRPYTIYNFEPIIKKEKKGESMPSRHVFSAFVISMAFLYIFSWLSIILFIVSILICIGRVIGGVHFPKDVIVGALIGILSGIIGFYLI